MYNQNMVFREVKCVVKHEVLSKETEKIHYTITENNTPHQIWTGNKPSLSHLRVFGCDAYVHAPKDKRTKLDSKLERCIFIGYKDGLKGYKLWNSETRKVVYSRDVVFREVKYVVTHEIISKEPEKIEFELKEDESNSTTEEDSKEEEPQNPSLRRSI